MELNKKIIVLAAIFNIAGLLVALFVIFPLFKEIEKISREFASQKASFQEITIKAKEFKELQGDYKTYQQDSEKIDNLFISSEAPVDFINFLEKNAAELRLKIEIMPGVSEKKSGDPWTFTTFQIGLTGSYPNFLKFIKKIELSSFPNAAGDRGYLVEILSLNIKKLTEKEIKAGTEALSTGDIEASLTIKTYTK